MLWSLRVAYILRPSLSLSSWHLPAWLGAEISERHSGAAYSLTEWTSEERTTMYDGRVALLMLCSVCHIPQCTQNCCGILNFTNLTRVLSSTEVPRYWTGTQVLNGYPGIETGIEYEMGTQVLKWVSGIERVPGYSNGTRVLKWLAGYWNGYRVLNGYPGIQTGTRVLKWVAGYWKGVSGIEMGTWVLKRVPGYWTGTWVLKQVPGYWTGTRLPFPSTSYVYSCVVHWRRLEHSRNWLSWTSRTTNWNDCRTHSDNWTASLTFTCLTTRSTIYLTPWVRVPE